MASQANREAQLLEEQSDVRAYVEHLDLYGYVIVDHALDADRVAELRSETEALYEKDHGCLENRKALPDILQVENLPNKGRIFEDFFINQRVLRVVRHFLGDDFVASDICSFGVVGQGYTKDGKAALGTFHVHDQIQVPGLPLSLVTFYPLVDVTQQNGATRALPGSHRSGRRPQASSYEGEVSLEAKAGSCVLFFGSLWHGPGPNWTNETRPAVVAEFKLPWIKPSIDFTRSLSLEVISRATPEALRIFGFPSRTPHTERWQWDTATGHVLGMHQASLRDEFGYCARCL